MAENGNSSPAFNPPMNRITDNDPQVVRVPLTQVDIGFRRSQAPDIKNQMSVRHLKNGG